MGLLGQHSTPDEILVRAVQGSATLSATLTYDAPGGALKGANRVPGTR